jgi:hypothetical protein
MGNCNLTIQFILRSINLRHFGSTDFQRSGFDSLFCASLRT